MSDVHALSIPLFAFAINVVVQFTSCRLLKLRLLPSLGVGLLAGWIAIVTFALQDSTAVLRTIFEGGLFFSCSWYCFFHFVNIGEASLRIRVLDELKNHGGRLTETEILGHYNPSSIIEARLVRMLRSREIIETPAGTYVLGPRRLLRTAAMIIQIIRLVIHGEERAREYTAVHGRARIVIFGGSGFIGQHLIALLQKEHRLFVAPSRGQFDLESKASTSALASYLKPTDVVVISAMIPPEKGRDEAVGARNVEIVRNVLSALESTKCSRLVLLSSDAVYASADSPFSKSTQPAPEDAYGRAHFAREELVREFSRRHGIPFAILRPSAVYGIGDTHGSYGVNRFVESARVRGSIQLFGEGEEIRDHVYVDDVAAVILSAIDQDVAGEMNIASGAALPFAEVAAAVAKRFSRPVNIERMSRERPIVHRKHDVSDLRASFREIRFLSLEEGLERMGVGK